MERKKVLVLKGNQVLEISPNLTVKTDQIDHQEMERKKVLVLKGNQVSLKKMIRNQVVLPITPSILEENPLKTRQQTLKKKVLVLKERKNLRVEVTDLKNLPLKSTVKKKLKSKIF